MRELRLAAKLLNRAVRLLLEVSEVPEAKRFAVRLYVLHVNCGVGQALVGAINACTKQNVSKHVHAIERDRDQNPDFDRMLEKFEQELLEAE